MKFENTFEVDAPIDEVYNALLDVERVAPCVPGAEVLEKTGEDSYQVAIKVKVGPISMTYKGTVEIVERDDEHHRAVMRARARETRGQGTADARVEMTLTEEGPERTKGTIVSDVQLAGRAAAMGRGVIQDVSAKIVTTFSQNLEQMLGGGGPAAEPQATGPEAPPANPAAAAAPATGAEAGGGPEAAAATAPPPPGTVGAPTPPTPPTPPPPPRPQPAEESALPVGQIVGSVLVSRLKDPKVLGAIGASAVVVFAVVRRRNR